MPPGFINDGSWPNFCLRNSVTGPRGFCRSWLHTDRYLVRYCCCIKSSFCTTLQASDPVLPPDPNGAKSGTSFTATAASLSALGPAKPRVSQGDQGAHKLPGQVKAALPPPPPPPSGHTRATRQQWRQGMMGNLISTQGRPATTSRVPLR